jgi:dihydroorotate dehydrogenase (NAD+) catalytic subunit
MHNITQQPIYDPAKTYDDNFDHGPFGEFKKSATLTSAPTIATFLGYPIASRFGIPAGPLLNSRYVGAALSHGFDIVTYKTQRSVTVPANQFPNVLFLNVPGRLTIEDSKKPQVGTKNPPKSLDELTITNSFGNPSRGPKFWVPDLTEAVSMARPGQLVIASVVGTIKPGFSDANYYADFAETAKLAAGSGVKAIEVNLSCPNVASEGVLCYTPQATTAIMKAVREAVPNVPLIAKIGYFAPEQSTLLEQVISGMAPYIDGIAAINTLPAPVVTDSGHQALPGPNRLTSGICGASIRWAGLEMVRRLSGLRTTRGFKYDIIGVGGVITPKDYDAYIEAGADVVQSATGAMWNADLANDIKSRA